VGLPVTIEIMFQFLFDHKQLRSQSLSQTRSIFGLPGEIDCALASNSVEIFMQLPENSEFGE